jgi:hypothetical protein
LTLSRLKRALLLYAALGVGSLPFVTDMTLRLVLWIFLAGLAVKSWIAWLQYKRDG